jgi:hypothetical protein
MASPFVTTQDFRTYFQQHQDIHSSSPKEFDPTLLAMTLNSLCRFLAKRWPILLPVIVGLIAIAVTLFIYFDSNTNG